MPQISFIECILLDKYNISPLIKSTEFRIVSLISIQKYYYQKIAYIMLESESQQQINLVQYFSAYAQQSAETIYQIKEAVYQMIKIDVQIKPVTMMDSFAQLQNSLRNNLDDLKRIDSILRGYVKDEQFNEKITGILSHKKINNYSYKNHDKQRQLQKVLTEQQLFSEGEKQFKLKSCFKEKIGFKQQKQQDGKGEENYHIDLNLKIKQLEIQIIELRKENCELKQKIEVFSQLSATPSKMLYSFGQPNPNQSELSKTKNLEKSEIINPTLPIKKQAQEVIKHSGQQIELVWNRNKQCLDLLNSLRLGLKKKSDKKKQQINKTKNKSKKMKLKRVQKQYDSNYTDKQQQTEESSTIMNQFSS